MESMKLRDEFAKAVYTAVLSRSESEIGYQCSDEEYAYAKADLLMAERAKRLTIYAPERLIDLTAWPSTSCQSPIEAELFAGELLRSETPFHCEHINDVWVFTVLDEDWKSSEDQAYERLGGGE